jgi:hypothetical protein|tara:strand:+ start:665 stop:1606 length:942 start_codon:yes stop_codon:yes gene_type:complete
MQISPYPPSGAAVGLTPLEVELEQVIGRHRGDTFYVDSNATGDGTGLNWDDAVTTIEAAVNLSASDDRIFVAPQHVETVTAAGGLDIDVAGLTIVGLGNGDQRPQVNFTTVVGADVNIDAAGVTIKNVRFTGGIDALTGPIDVNAADFTLLDCITQDVTGQATDFIVLDANADRCGIFRHTHRGAAAAGADTWLSAVGCDRLVVESPVVDGNFAVGCVELVTTACTLFKVYGGGGRGAFFHTRNSADIVFDDVVTGSTGDVGPGLYCMLADNASGTLAEMTVAATGQFWDPIEMVNLAGESSVGTDITATSDA